MKKNLACPLLKEQIRSCLCENGLHAYVYPRHDVKAVTVQAWVKTGSVHEEEFSGCGLSHFLEHMIFQGSKTFPGNSAAAFVADLGGNINAVTSLEYTSVFVNLPSEHACEGIRLISSMLHEPLLEENAFNSEREVILRELAMYKDSPVQNLFNRLREETFSAHPLRYPVGGYVDLLKSLTPEMMRTYHKRRYTPGRIFYTVVGDVEEEQIFDAIRKEYAVREHGNLQEIIFPEENAPRQSRFISTEFQAPQTYCGACWHTPGAGSADALPVSVFADILGNGDSSRLYETLVNREQLAVDLLFTSDALRSIGYSSIITMSEPRHAKRLTERSLEIVQDFVQNGPTEEELTRTCNCQRAEYLRTLQTNDSIARLMGMNTLHNGTPDASDSYLPRLAALTKEDLIRAGKEYFSMDSVTVIEQHPPVRKSCRPAKKKAAGSKEVHFHVLEKGQRLLFLEDRSLPLVSVEIMLPGGLLDETASRHGLSSLLRETLPAGNGKYTESELNHILDLHGIDLDVRSGNVALTISADGPEEHLDLICSLLSDLLATPRFEEKIVQRECANLVEEIKSRSMDPRSCAVSSFREAFFGDHPFGVNPETLLKEIVTLKGKDLKRFYREVSLDPARCVIAIAGDLSGEEARDAARKILGKCPWKGKHPGTYPEPSYPEKETRVEKTLPREQAVVMTGMRGVDLRSSDSLILDLIRMDASSMAGRLFQAVRNDNSLVYYAHFTQICGYGFDGGMGYMGATSPEGVAILEKIFDKEIRTMIKEGLSEKAFINAKRNLLFQMDSLAQAPGDYLGVAATYEFVADSREIFLKQREALEKLTLEEFNGRVKKLFSGKKRLTCIVLPEKKTSEGSSSGKVKTKSTNKVSGKGK
ncbi:MAG: insulinase family protein [Lentisphaeria bacterium]|nr:insulinase family protein [Lentisphaeria bacterium]